MEKNIGEATVKPLMALTPAYPPNLEPVAFVHFTKDEIITRLNSYDALKQRVKVLEEAIKGAIEKIEDHDAAPFQCESVEGAEAVGDAKTILKEALAPPVGEKETL